MFCYLQSLNAQEFAADIQQDKDCLIEVLLQERDKMYLELSRLREIDNGALAKAETINKNKEEQIRKKEKKIKRSEG